MIITRPQTPEEFELYYDLRWRILRAPWNQPRGSEKDDREVDAFHVMVCETGKIPVGVGRAHFNTPVETQIRYMAVEESQRGKGVGAVILKELEKRAAAKGAKYIALNARDNAVPFYERYGYRVIKQSHTLFGSIPHFEMRKDL